MLLVMGDWRYVTKVGRRFMTDYTVAAIDANAQEDIETFHGDQARRRAFSSGWIGQVRI